MISSFECIELFEDGFIFVSLQKAKDTIVKFF